MSLFSVSVLRRLPGSSSAAALAMAAVAVAAPAAAQELPMAADLPVRGVEEYADGIPRPGDVIGHEVGTRHTESARIAGYFREVARASDRVRVREHALSYEDRPLLHAVVTSVENQARLEEIRRANRRLSDAPGAVPDSALGAMPAVVYLGYSVHGDEASGSEAAMVVLYHLAAGSGPAVDSLLSDAVVLVDPMFNPDGRDRFVDWVNRNRGATPVADPQDREHVQPWPGGRTNHYWFDLNRDWLPAQLPETRGRLEVFHRWRPQVLTDFHEMGGDATYFFQPGVPSRTNPHTTERNQELTARIARRHAASLDRIDQLYYTRETYDDFYYGKGSTYPDLNGAVGILFEQASSRALVTDTENGPLRYATTVRNQVATSLSTLRAVREMRTDLLAFQRDYYAGAPEVARRSPVKAWVVGGERAPTRARAMLEVLRRHRVRVHRLARDVEVGGERFRAGEGWVVPVDQPQARLVRAFLEERTSFPDSIFYDVSTWTLPLAFDVDHAALRRAPSGLLGEPVEGIELEPAASRLVGGEAGFAYLLPWGRYFAPRALHRFQEAGVLPRVMDDPFTAEVDGERRSFGRGTIVVPVGQPGVEATAVHRAARRAAERDRVTLYATDTGLTPEGPDLGSPGGEPLPPPRIGLLVGGAPGRSYGQGAGAYDAGQVWHLLSERFGVPVSLLDLERVPGMDLDRYDVIVAAGGEYGEASVEPLEAWVREGGRLVVLARAVDWAAESGFLELEQRTAPVDSAVAGVAYGELGRARGAHEIGGSILRARLDTTHPLAFGLPEVLPVFRAHESFWEPASPPERNVGVYPEEDPLWSGYLSDLRRDQAAGATAAVAAELGAGEVTAIMDDPNFRAFWYGSNRLFLNAVFLGAAY